MPQHVVVQCTEIDTKKVEIKFKHGEKYCTNVERVMIKGAIVVVACVTELWTGIKRHEVPSTRVFLSSFYKGGGGVNRSDSHDFYCLYFTYFLPSSVCSISLTRVDKCPRNSGANTTTSSLSLTVMGVVRLLIKLLT